MTINLTELRDEPLGKHPIQAAVACMPMCYGNCMGGMEDEQDVIPANSVSSFTFDVDGLSDEALEPRPGVNAFSCGGTSGCIGVICMSLQSRAVSKG